MDWPAHFANVSKHSASFGAAVLQADDIDAINRYIVYAPIHTKEAGKIKDEWILWHDDLSWWEKNMEPGIYDKARNIRNRFNLANARTKEEKADVRHVQQTGLTTEEMQGGVRRTLSTGMYDERPEILPSPTKVAVGVSLFAALAGFVAYRLYVPDFIRKR